MSITLFISLCLYSLAVFLPSTDTQTIPAIPLIFGTVALGIAIALFASAYQDQIKDIATLRKLTKDKIVYQTQYDAISNDLRVELGKYLKHEAEIFDKLTPENLSILMVKYPEIRGVETVTMLAENLRNFRKCIYRTDLTFNEKVTELETRQAMRWLHGPIPVYRED